MNNKKYKRNSETAERSQTNNNYKNNNRSAQYLNKFIRIGTLNVKGLHSNDKLENIFDEFLDTDINLDVIGLTETKLNDKIGKLNSHIKNITFGRQDYLITIILAE